MTSESILQKKTFFQLTRSRLVLLIPLITLTISNHTSAQAPVSTDRNSPYRTQLIEPFHIIDNVYHVGTTLHNSSYLITSNEGHILIDSTLEEMVPGIQVNIEKLGFRIRDVKLVLSTHAHHDHVGGHAIMKEITGATLLATEADAAVIETGGIADFREGDPWRPAKVDRFIKDKEEIKLGNTVLTAHLTPGHTKGCTTWTTVVEDGGEKYDLVLICGLRMDPNGLLVGNAKYPEMPQEFAYTFAVAKTLPVDIFLGAHGSWYEVGDKVEKMKQNPKMNPFIDPEGYYRIVDGWEKAYLDRLKKER